MREEISLDGTWKFIEVKSEKIDAQEPCLPVEADYNEGRFPGSIQGALIDCGKMGSPFFGHGHEDFRWIEDTDWYMVKEFRHSEISYPKCRIRATLDRTSSKEYMLALETDNYARVISIDAQGELDDNFFDMAPRSVRTVRIKLRSDCCEHPRVSIRALNM